MAKPSSDPVRGRMLELCQDIAERIITLREYAMAPDNAWLAKSELEQVTILMSELEDQLEKIRRYDAGED